MHITAPFKNTYGWVQKQVEKHTPSKETQKKIGTKIKSFFEEMKFYAAVMAIPLAIGASICLTFTCPIAALIVIPLLFGLAYFISYRALSIINDSN